MIYARPNAVVAVRETAKQNDKPLSTEKKAKINETVFADLGVALPDAEGGARGRFLGVDEPRAD